MELSYEEIRSIHRQEKNSSRLVKLDEDFYAQLSAFLTREKKAYFDSLKDFSVTKARNFTNLKRMVEELFLLREKKILGKALMMSRSGEANNDPIPIEEAQLLKKISKDLASHNSLLDSLFKGKTEKKQAEPKALSNLSIRIISDVPSFVGADMKEYGPYSKGKTVSLPEKIAKLLMERKLAKAEK